MPVQGLGNVVSVEDFAAGVGSHVATIRRLCREGSLPSVRIGGRWVVLTDLIAEQARARSLDRDGAEGLPAYDDLLLND